MAFSQKTREALLVASHRHCCLCHKPSGTKMEIHHMVPKEQGGGDSYDNGIPLCFDCHAEVMAYNDKHPKGTKFTPRELREHRDQWFAIASRSPWESSLAARPLPSGEPSPSVEQLGEEIRKADVWNPNVMIGLAPSVLTLGDADRRQLVRLLDAMLADGDDYERWNAALIIELFMDWDPRIVPAELLERMAHDPFFSVRTAAAVGYYHLAGAAPADVPLATLDALAHWDEDWYVTTPATSAMVRLARTRSVALDLLATGLREESPDAQRHASHALERVAREAPYALRDEIASLLHESQLEDVRAVGDLWSKTIEERREQQQGLDHYIF